MTETRHVTAQDVVLDALRNEILSGALQPGDQVVQETVAERYGVSRVPVREALRMLEAEGQVVYHPHRGYFVAQLSVTDLLEVYRLRELLEAEAIRTAVPRLTDSEVSAIAALLEQVTAASEAGDIMALTAANRRFHFAIFEESDLPRLTRLLQQLWDATDAYRALYFHHEDNRRRVAREHARMMTALRKRDADALVRLHDEHRTNSVGTVRALLEQRLDAIR